MIPDGVDVTEPVPVPVLRHVQAPLRLVAELADTEVAAVTDTTQVPVPEQPPPDQPVNVEPVVGVAVSVTDVP